MAAVLTAPIALTGCSGSAAPQIAYVVDGPLSTYNSNTVIGAASAGAQAFARTLTGFGYHGPDGQVVADRDCRWCSTTRSPTTRCTPTASR
jgi:peptide/nickel transport system substrate-binding protein